MSKNNLVSLFEINPKLFKQNNFNAWNENAEFWLTQDLKHFSDIEYNLIKHLTNTIKESELEKPVVVDVGCGNAFVYEMLSESGCNFQYIGLDFNALFIEYIKQKYSQRENFEAYVYDIENPPPIHLVECGDIIVNCFNYFEVPNLSAAFANTATIIKTSGSLIVVTIDVISQIMAVSESPGSLSENLYKYVHVRAGLAYTKRMVTKKGEADRVYRGITYSMADYVKNAHKNNLEFVDYEEINKTDDTPPELFQIIIFKKRV